MYSNTELDVHFDQKFDAIWVGSLVTHFSEVYTTRFLQWAFDLLAPSGIAIVTTHGNYVNSRLTTENYGILQKGIDDIRADLDNKGYGYSDYPEQEDYGISVVSRDWYDALVSGYPNMDITAYLEQRWDNHHDVLIIKNTE